MDGIERILVIKLRHIGDVLLIVPTIRAIRGTFPDAYIAALVNKGTEDMLTRNPLLNEVIVYDRGIHRLPFLKNIKTEIEFVRALKLKGFDMTVDLTSGDRSAIYSYLSGARYRIAYDPVGEGFIGKSHLYNRLGRRLEDNNHMVLQNLQLVREFGIDTKDLRVDIFFSDEDQGYVDNMLLNRGVRASDPIIHVHPISRWLFKCWRAESMAETIDFCADSIGVKVVITSGPDEREMNKVRDIMKYVRSSPINLAGLLTLKQVAALSSRAILFFGVDSAPMHIAAAVGTAVVALFGPSGAFKWGPWDNNDYRDQGPYPGKNGIQTFGIHTAIQKDWDCIPCWKDGCSGSKKSECLEEIKTGEVIKVITEKLGKRGA